MKNIKLFLILLIFTTSYTGPLKANSEKGTKFILLGHLYPLIKNHENGLLKLAEKVNSHNPDYVFILGDSKLDEADTVEKIEKLFRGKVLYSPGYDESNTENVKYKKNIGYFNKLINEKDVRFILLDSNKKEISKIRKILKDYLKNKFTNGPTVLLTHHRIWDDTLIREGHDKHFYFKEIYPIIKNEVNYIFAGNGKRQYFRDLKDDLIYGKQNVNVIFWLDKIGSMDNYAIGMGDGHPKAIFTIAEVIDNKLFISGDYASIADYEILPKNLISPDKHRLSTKYTGGGYFFVNKKKLYLGIFIILLISFIFYIRKKIKF